MANQKKFSPGVVAQLKDKVNKEEKNLINAYLNKKEFIYKFNDFDFKYCDFDAIDSNLGDELVSIFKRNLNQKINDYRKADFECAKFLYENLKLNLRDASDVNFWSYLHHFDMYKYIHLRWNEIENPSRGSQETYINRHWLMSLSSQKHLINYPLTTLWWSVHLTIDNDRKNPYELTKIYFNNNRYRTVTFGGSSYVRHKEAIIGILEFYKIHNIRETKDYGDTISKFVNLLGGSKPLGFFKRDWFIKQLESKFSSLYKVDDLKLEFDDNEETEEPILPKNNTKIIIDKIIKYFNLSENGNHNLTDFKTESTWSIPITNNSKKGFLLICYNEEGNINRITIQSLLTKNRETYKNGIFRNNTVNSLLITENEDCLIGICYKIKGVKYFKAHLLSQLKENNDMVGLKGYQTTYENYDSIKYKILNIDLKNKLGHLLMKSFTAKGKAINNDYYKLELKELKKHWPEIFV